MIHIMPLRSFIVWLEVQIYVLPLLDKLLEAG
jgi:hypothetical protein